MKRTLLLMAILLSCFSVISAQGIEIAFALPSGNDHLSANTAKMLRSRFLPAMTENGVETAEISTIAIKPEISFVNRQVVEGGHEKHTHKRYTVRFHMYESCDKHDFCKLRHYCARRGIQR